MSDLKTLNGAVSVLINISSVSVEEDEMNPSNEMRIVTNGTLIGNGLGHYRLEYEETDPETDEASLVRLDLTDKGIIMDRDGATKAYMMFETDKAFSSNYTTEYGSIPIELYTVQSYWSIKNDSGSIDLKYQIMTDGSYPWIQILTIRFALNE